MSQHFLLSAQARTLSLASVARLSEQEARDTFRQIRWAATDGEPVCPRCGCLAVYEYASRPIFKCQGCGHQFSVTSGTIFASRKLPIRDYLLAIAIFVNGAKGHSALQLSRDLDVQYKTAFVLSHKLREALAAEQKGKELSGHVEIDGAYFGGHIRPENRKEDRIDRRLAQHQTGKRRCVVAMRERGGRTLPFVFLAEDDAVPMIRRTVQVGSIKRAGNPVGNLTGGSVTYSNNPEKIETIRDDGLIEGPEPTIAALTGRIDVRFADTTLIDLAAGGSRVDLEFTYTLSAQSKLVLTAHEVYLPKPKLAVEGPGGVQASFDFRGAANDAAGRLLTVTLTNDLDGLVYD